MSAHVCSDTQFATLVATVATMKYSPVKPGEEQAVASLLKRENIRSVNYRYNQHDRIAPCDMSKATLGGWTLTGLINLARCIDYQSCERPDYEKSRAHHMLIRIIAFLLLEMPEVDQRLKANPTWSI
jgi:hypothetical protein